MGFSNASTNKLVNVPGRLLLGLVRPALSFRHVLSTVTRRRFVGGLESHTDSIFAGYVLVTAGLVLAFRDRVTPWRTIVFIHLLVGAILVCLRFLPERLPGPIRFLRDFYPVILISPLYKEVELLARSFGNWGLTERIRDGEVFLFHGHPSLYLSERLPWVPLSEYLHFCYFAYILLIPVVGGYWYKTRRAAFRELVFVVSLVYLLSFLFFILLPVDSPFYLSPPPGPPLSQHFFYDLVHFISARGGARGGAFPSTHVSVSTVVFLVALRWQRSLAVVLAPIVAGVMVATVYGRFHYMLDVFAGVAVAVAAVAAFGSPQPRAFPIRLRARRALRSFERRLREARVVARAFQSGRHPILAHIIPTRRCNLACAYCNEYDDISEPVPTEEMLRRVDSLARLKTTIITLSGGEPLLHPELEVIVRRIRGHGAVATLITNGYLLTAERVQKLNRAGLDHLQISIDNLSPDPVSMKSLKVLDQKLQILALNAEFDVNINSVLGSPVRAPGDAIAVSRRARELGFTGTVGILHDRSGRLQPLSSEQQAIYDEILGLARPSLFSFAYYNQFQKQLAKGLPNDWQCHAGSRYLYVCEDGLVHYCSQQRGHPGIPLADYTAEHLEREFHTVKPCAPFCTVSCVHQTAVLDEIRTRPREALERLFSGASDAGVAMPGSVRALAWLFLPSRPGGRRRFFRTAALKLLRVK